MLRLINITKILCVIVLSAYQLTGQITADFSANQTEGCGNLPVVFIDNSKSDNTNIVAWEWDIAGIKTTKQNPGRIFDVPGKYDICLKITDDKGNTSTECKENFIIVHHIPHADFSIDKPKGCSPLTTHFTDFSSTPNGNITSWTWDIGGTTNVKVSNTPITDLGSTYTSPGSYSMSLTIIDEKGCIATVSKRDILEIQSVPPPILRKNYINTCGESWTISFVNENVDLNADYQWNFGNGKLYNGPVPPMMDFQAKQTFDISLIVSNEDCIDTFFYEDYVLTNPVSKIGMSTEAICLGDSVQFEDVSELFADSIRWDFGDGTYNTSNKPKHRYDQSGCYDIKLYRFRGDCTDTLNHECFLVRANPVPEYTIDNQYTCSLPAAVSISAKNDHSYTFINNLTSEQINGSQAVFNISEYGNYYLDIEAIDQYGCKGSEDSVVIDIQKFEANLPQKSIGGCVPYIPSLADSIISAVPIVSYDWKLYTSPTQTSKLKKPQFNIDKVGNYDLELIVRNIYGCKDTIYRSNYINGGTPPTVDFEAAPLEDCLSEVRTFTDQSSNNADYWIWDFGDGNNSSEQDPTHTYNQIGTFDVSLTTFFNGCGNEILKPDYINILEPVSNYEIIHDCEDPYTITINELTVGADSLAWQIGPAIGIKDTIIDSLFSEYTFPSVGHYIVGLYTTNFTTGCEHLRIDTIQITNPEFSSFTVDKVQGCIPLTLPFGLDLVDVDSFYFNNINNDPLTVSDSTVNFTAAGTYQLPIMVVRDIHGCIDSITSPLEILANGIEAIADFTPTICVPDTVDFLSISRDTFSTITQWEWTIGDSVFYGNEVSLYLTNAGKKDVSLKVIDEWNCADSITLEAGIEAVNLNTDFTSDTLGCTNTEVVFIPSGDDINTIGFEWSFGDGNISNQAVPRHTFTSEGKYDICLNLIDARGCENKICKPDHIEIKNPKAQFTADPRVETCPPLYSVFTNNSINATSYLWDFGDDSGTSFVTSPSHIYFEPDTFDVTLIAIRSESCKDTLHVEDYITLLGPRADFTYQVDGNCLPLHAKLSVETDKFYNYFWDFGDGNIDTSLVTLKSDTKYYRYDTPGNYIPKIKVTDENGCARTFSAPNISVNSIDLNTSTLPDPFCQLPADIQITNNSVSTNPNVTYEWQIFNVQNEYSSFSKDISLSIEDYGEFNVTLIGDTENCRDTLTQQEMIKVGASPKVAFDVDKPIICEGNKTLFTNTSTISYGNIDTWIWNLGDGTLSNNQDVVHSYSGIKTANISLTAISDIGCTSTESQNIFVEHRPNIALEHPFIICLDESAELIARVTPDTFDLYTWQDSEGNIICDNCHRTAVTPDTTSTFVFEVKSTNSCVYKDSIELRVAPVFAPTLTIDNDTIICEGDQIELEVLDYNDTYSYNWTHDGSIICDSHCSSIYISPVEKSIYVAKVQNEYGCDNIDSILVDVENSIPDFLASEKYICEGNTTFLHITGGNSAIWTPNAALSCLDCDSTYVSTPKEDKFFVQVTSDVGCLYIDSIELKIIPKNSIEAGDNITICKGEEIILDGQGIGELAWIDMSTQEVYNQKTVALYPNTSTQYLLTATKDECALTDSIYAEVLIKATIEAIGDTICYGDEAYLTANGLAYDYRWIFEGSVIGQESDLYIDPAQSSQLMVVGSRTTCIPDTQYTFVKVHPRIMYELLEDNYTINYNNRIAIEALFNEEDNYTYNWSPPTGLSCTDCPNPTIYGLDESVDFEVEVIDTETDCSISQSVSVFLDESCDRTGFYIPNIFSPNGNGNNDYFYLMPESKTEFLSISILDRWGNIFFRSKDPDFVWDGTFNGRVIGNGVYLMMIEAICPETNEIYHFGSDLTIIR